MPDAPRRRPVPDDQFGGRLKGSYLLDLEVTAIAELTPSFRSIRFASPDLVGFEWQAGQDIMFDVPGTEPPLRRRYTIRRADPVAGTLDIEVVLHGEGPFARWAAAVEIGDHIHGIGPRGVIALRAGAPQFVFVGDESAMPVTMAMLEALPSGVAASAVLITEDGHPVGGAVRPDITWVANDEAVAAIRSLPLEKGAVAYVNGERSLVRAASEALAERGLDRDDIMAKLYWRLDQANAAHGEPGRD